MPSPNNVTMLRDILILCPVMAIGLLTDSLLVFKANIVSRVSWRWMRVGLRVLPLLPSRLTNNATMHRDFPRQHMIMAIGIRVMKSFLYVEIAEGDECHVHCHHDHRIRP